MKRAHRSTHRLAWCLIVPGLAYLLWLAVVGRGTVPTEDRLPDISQEERFQ